MQADDTRIILQKLGKIEAAMEYTAETIAELKDDMRELKHEAAEREYRIAQIEQCQAACEERRKITMGIVGGVAGTISAALTALITHLIGG
ncbi:MAG: hypothetical protein E7Z72_00610 [Methanocorpusculum parvum]|nr:hypothetical protein [Methanocorpusculum parvum]